MVSKLTKKQFLDLEDFLNTDDGIYETIQGCLERGIEALNLPKDLDSELDVDYKLELMSIGRNDK